jgi:hypothetical protein
MNGSYMRVTSLVNSENEPAEQLKKDGVNFIKFVDIIILHRV